MFLLQPQRLRRLVSASPTRRSVCCPVEQYALDKHQHTDVFSPLRHTHSGHKADRDRAGVTSLLFTDSSPLAGAEITKATEPLSNRSWFKPLFQVLGAQSLRF
jgi:hypothetical protein